MNTESKVLSEIVTWSKYSRYVPTLGRRETWNEIVDRNKAMHINRFPHMKDQIEQAYRLVYNKKVLPSMRSLQFAGKAIETNHAKIYNCSFVALDDYRAFNEAFFLLLSGCGVGYSVQWHHIDKLPSIKKPVKMKKFLVADDIMGWADALKALIKSYMGLTSHEPNFDFGCIRPKGSPLKTSGGVAPGPEPLRLCLAHIKAILDRKEDGEKLTPLECHDIMCHIADSVLAGGVRRSAMIALFSHDDQEMLTCKFGNWWELNPQRGRANNSVVLKRGTVNKEYFMELWKKVELSNSGEPGFYFTTDLNVGTNPCCEIALNPNQFCNLVEVNGSDIEDQADLNERVATAAFLGTLQASYTDFHYLRSIWQKTTEKEALLGIGMTGIASGRVSELDLEQAVNLAKDVNRQVAEDIGINTAARVTCVKPSGTSSLVLGTSSGIHAWHNEYYIRRMRVGKAEALYTYLSIHHPHLIEDDFLKPDEQAVISVPQQAPKGAITRWEESAISFLERVKDFNIRWIKPGHISGPNTHNISATVTMRNDEWTEVGEWLWANQDYYNGLSFLPEDLGTYAQTPFESITKEKFEELKKGITNIDLSLIFENSDNTTLSDQAACAGNNCQI